MSERIGVFPGSFDPPHNGHADLMRRALELFDLLYVAVLKNESKSCIFSTEERISMLEDLLQEQVHTDSSCPDSCSVVESFSGLLVEYALSREATAIVRGLRSVADFDYEVPMTRMNRHLAGTVDTVFLLASGEHAALSSSLIREVARLGGDVSGLVPAGVFQRLREKV